MALALDGVRKIASEEHLQEISFNATSRVVSFAPDCPGPVRQPQPHNRTTAPASSMDTCDFRSCPLRLVSTTRTHAQVGARINVYYSTGTVGTSLDHPRQGKTQLFRRNVDLAALREILRDPRVHTDKGYQRRQSQRQNGCAQEAPVSWAQPRRLGNDDLEAPDDEEAEARTQLQKLQKEAKDIAVDIKNVTAIVRGFEKTREEGAAALKQRKRQAEAARSADEERRKV